MRARELLLGLATLGVASCHRAPSRQATESEAFLFSYFTRNGEDGLHLAYSADGTTWKPLNGGRSLLKPESSALVLGGSSGRVTPR
jgi:hypothetical protein